MAAVRIRDIQFYSTADHPVISLFVAASKTDQEAKGVARALACRCSVDRWDGVVGSWICPACATRRHLAERGTDSKGAPLFINTEGNMVSKQEVVRAWRSLSISGAGVTGHSARRSGAKDYARMGWALYRIQYLGRWASSAVLGYVEEAFADAMQGLTIVGALADSAPLAGLDKANLKDNPGMQAFSKRIEEVEMKLEQRRLGLGGEGAVGARDAPEPPGKAQSEEDLVVVGSRVHRVLGESLRWPRASWTTACGWRFGLGGAAALSAADAPLTAPRCGHSVCWPGRGGGAG